MAFFPCTRFEDQIILRFKGEQYQQKNNTELEKMETDLKLHKELHDMYSYVTKLAIICIKLNLKLIIENPYSTQHYLNRYWAIKPVVIDNDRRDRGDYFKKPTQYYFINIEPKYNLILEAQNYNSYGCSIEKINNSNCQIAKNRKVMRSMIHSDYANRFIREFIL